MDENLSYTLDALIARAPSSRRPETPAPPIPSLRPQVQGDARVDVRPDGITATASGGASVDERARIGGTSVRAGGGVHGQIEGGVTRDQGMVRYTLSGEVSGFLTAGASTSRFGGSYRMDERATARFEVAVPESAPGGTDIRNVNPFDPASMPAGSRITMDAAQYSSREFNANLRYLATRDRTNHEQGVNVAIEALGQERVRVTAGPREAIDAYHGIGVDLGDARVMLGRNDRYSGGTIGSAEFDLSGEPGRQAYGQFMRDGTLPGRDGPGISGVSTVTRLDGSSQSQLDLGLGRWSTTLAGDANTASTVRTVHGDGSAETSTTIRYGGRDAELQIDQTYDRDRAPTGRSYAFRLTPSDHEASLLNEVYGRNPGSPTFSGGQEATLRFSEADMQRLQALTGRAHQNIMRTGSDDVIRNLAEAGGGATPSPSDFAIDMLRNRSTLAGVPTILHTLARRSGDETRGVDPSAMTPMPGAVETPAAPGTTRAVAPPPTAGAGEPPSPTQTPDTAATAPSASRVPLGSDLHPEHALYAAIRSRAPEGLGEDRLAQATQQARQADIAPDGVAGVRVHEGNLWVWGATPGYRTRIDLSEAAPPAEETSARLLAQSTQRTPDPAIGAPTEQREQPVMARG